MPIFIDRGAPLNQWSVPDTPHRLIAMLVWEGARRQGSDATADFGELARKSGFEEITIPTS